MLNVVLRPSGNLETGKPIKEAYVTPLSGTEIQVLFPSTVESFTRLSMRGTFTLFQMSIGEDFGRSLVSSIRELFPSACKGGVGTKDRSDSLDGEEELSVPIRSLSRKPRSARDARRASRPEL